MSDPTHSPPTLRPEDATLPPGHLFRRLPAVLGALGLAGLGLTAALAGSAPKGHVYFAYLVAYAYFLSIALGGLFFVLVQYASRAGWSVVVRRLAENVMATLPLFALLFAGVLLGLHTLYHHWMDPGAVARDPILAHKRPYLNEGFFLVRAAIYLGVWTLLSVYYARRSRRQDRTGEPRITRVLEILSAPGLILFALTVSFAAFDWLMSIDPHWYSTIWGIYFFAGCMVALCAVLILLTVALGSGPTRRAGTPNVEHLHDLGKLLFGFSCFWAYIAFSQFMLYWYGNLPEETIFFARRWYVLPEGAAAGQDWPLSSWRYVTLLLALGHFVVPFFFLLPRTVKRHPTLLALGAGWMLLMHLVDTYWLIMPNLHPRGVVFHLVDVTAVLGVGGLFGALLFWLLGRGALLPLRDPRLPESLRFENS